MINMHTKFEVSMITCLHTVCKATHNVKIRVLRHPFGDIGATHRVHLWLDGKRRFIVGFLLVII